MNKRVLSIYSIVFCISHAYSMDHGQSHNTSATKDGRNSLHEVFVESGRLEQEAKQLFEKQKKSELLETVNKLKQQWRDACINQAVGDCVSTLQQAVALNAEAFEDYAAFLASEENGTPCINQMPEITQNEHALALSKINGEVTKLLVNAPAGSDQRDNLHLIESIISQACYKHTHERALPESRELIFKLQQDHKRKHCAIL